jgi:HK97 family phage major capsid protein
MEQVQNDLLKAVHDLRESWDANVKRLESEQKERDERINHEINRLETELSKRNTPASAGAKTEHQKAFEAFARFGDESVLKVMSVGTSADGGYTVPVELDRAIYQLALEASPIRQLANVIRVNSDSYQKLVGIHGATAGWAAETTARSNTNSPQFAQLTPYMGEIYAVVHATQKVLEDSMVDIEAYIASELADGFATYEDAAFVSGNGVSRPKGFFGYAFATSADSARTFGEIQYVPTGVDGAFGTVAANSSNILFDVQAAIKDVYRQNATWVMPRAVLNDIRKFRDTTNQYLWQPSLIANQPSMLLGNPVVVDENMPAKASNSYSIAFADFKKAYTVVDRIGTTMLRDPYTAKPYVVFYARKRVGGFLVDSNAIKAVKFYTS